MSENRSAGSCFIESIEFMVFTIHKHKHTYIQLENELKSDEIKNWLKVAERVNETNARTHNLMQSQNI